MVLLTIVDGGNVFLIIFTGNKVICVYVYS